MLSGKLFLRGLELPALIINSNPLHCLEDFGSGNNTGLKKVRRNPAHSISNSSRGRILQIITETTELKMGKSQLRKLRSQQGDRINLTGFSSGHD